MFKTKKPHHNNDKFQFYFGYVRSFDSINVAMCGVYYLFSTTDLKKSLLLERVGRFCTSKPSSDLEASVMRLETSFLIMPILKSASKTLRFIARILALACLPPAMMAL